MKSFFLGLFLRIYNIEELLAMSSALLEDPGDLRISTVKILGL